MAAVKSGGPCRVPTPQGYRGEGVFDNFWEAEFERMENHLYHHRTHGDLGQDWQSGRSIADISTVKTAYFGLGPVAADMFRPASKRDYRHPRLIEGYGLTKRLPCVVEPDGWPA